jgi:hypothetical protein
MWTIKARGRSFYVNHVSCEMPWSTKETPDSNHTKGSIKIRKCVLRIDQDNCATITKPTSNDIARLKYKKPPIRVLYGALYADSVNRAVENHQLKQGKILLVKGICGNNFYISEFYKDTDITLLTLTLPSYAMRILNPYEQYYRLYDETEDDEIWEIEEYEDDESDDAE